MNDITQAFRRLRQSPGIGATTAIYSIVDRALLNPIPGTDSHRLMQIAEVNKKHLDKGWFHGVRTPILHEIRDQARWFEATAWYYNRRLVRPENGFQKSVSGALVSADFFELFDIPPLMGRWFVTNDITPLGSDGYPAQDSVIVVSHRFWKTVMAADPAATGRRVEIQQMQHTVIGVMPPEFGFPSGSTDVWIAAADPEPGDYAFRGSSTRVFARLRNGESPEAIQAKLSSLGWRVKDALLSDETFAGRRNFEDFSKDGWDLRIRPLKLRFANEALRKTYFGLTGAIVFVLLIVCANLANLMLVRGEARGRECALRSALGASPLRLLHTNMAECLVLGLVGGLGGIVLAHWFTDLLSGFLPASFPRLRLVELDWSMLFTAFSIATGAAVLMGLVPSVRAARTLSAAVLKESGAQATSSRAWRSYRGGLVVIQVALALVLLSGAGLMIQSVNKLLRVETGIQIERLAFVRINLPWKKYAGFHKSTIDGRNAKFREMQERIATIPGIESAAMFKDGFKLKGGVPGQDETAIMHQVGIGVRNDDFFKTVGMPILRGRTLQPEDLLGGGIVVSKRVAEIFWPGENPIGKRLRLGRAQMRMVVGMVGDARFYRFEEELLPRIYRPYHELDLAGPSPVVAIRLKADPDSLIPKIRRQLKEAEPAMGTPGFEVVADTFHRSTEIRRTFRNWLIAFAVVGAFLAALGIYAVVSLSVAGRAREIGIRMAVGATIGRIVVMVFQEHGKLVAAGTVAGLFAAWWLTRFIETHLFQVNALDVGVFGQAVIGLLGIALLSILIPAQQVARTQPMDALRHD